MANVPVTKASVWQGLAMVQSAFGLSTPYSVEADALALRDDGTPLGNGWLLAYATYYPDDVWPIDVTWNPATGRLAYLSGSLAWFQL